MVAASLAAACGPEALRPSPHERYARSLTRAGLDETALGRDWIAAADRALAEPADARLPLRTTLDVPSTEAWAQGWRFELRRGQRLTVRATTPSGDSTFVFADLYAPSSTDTTRRLRKLTSATSDPPALDWEARADGPVVLRLQSELLRGVRLSVNVETVPSLAFPVEGQDRRAILSVFGDVRAGGRRAHQGIDIAAPRGTPALAATGGLVASAGTNRLGGNLVWVFDPKRRLMLYYAHLDRHGVRAGQRVDRGDTVGLVGTTGNAAGTVPHLHFGIYAHGEGALDPRPFVY